MLLSLNIQIMPSGSKAGFLESTKTASYHVKSVINCQQSGKTAAFKLVVLRDGANKRYDFEAENPRQAGKFTIIWWEICRELGWRLFQMKSYSVSAHYRRCTRRNGPVPLGRVGQEKADRFPSSFSLREGCVYALCYFLWCIWNYSMQLYIGYSNGHDTWYEVH